MNIDNTELLEAMAHSIVRHCIEESNQYEFISTNGSFSEEDLVQEAVISAIEADYSDVVSSIKAFYANRMKGAVKNYMSRKSTGFVPIRDETRNLSVDYPDADSSYPDEEVGTFEDTYYPPVPCAESLVEYIETSHEIIREVITTLPGYYGSMILKRYGLWSDDEREWTTAELADEYNVSTQWVRHCLADGLKTLKKNPKLRELYELNR